jgi:asparagine synthase (glutamine-hydrolysing)
MCGIAGLTSRSGAIDARHVKVMTDALAHRGPDGEGFYINTTCTVGFGHRRLAIIDLSSAGAQPMTNEDQTIWLTYNGEIYNFQEVRNDLEKRGHTFHSNSDSEVIIHAYEEWGVECLSRFNGMFAFGLWDEPRNRLWLVRDRLGIKPLFYTLLPDGVAFA